MRWLCDAVALHRPWLPPTETARRILSLNHGAWLARWLSAVAAAACSSEPCARPGEVCKGCWDRGPKPRPPPRHWLGERSGTESWVCDSISMASRHISEEGLSGTPGGGGNGKFQSKLLLCSEQRAISRCKQGQAVVPDRGLPGSVPCNYGQNKRDDPHFNLLPRLQSGSQRGFAVRRAWVSSLCGTPVDRG